MAQDAKNRMMVRREELFDEELKLWDNGTKVSPMRLMITAGVEGTPDMKFMFQGYSRPMPKESHKTTIRQPIGRAGGLLSRFG
jgi:hypothetical protein